MAKYMVLFIKRSNGYLEEVYESNKLGECGDKAKEATNSGPVPGPKFETTGDRGIDESKGCRYINHNGVLKKVC